jgi:hypothetical protein
MQEFASWGRRVVLAVSVASVLAACGGGGDSGSSGSASTTAPGAGGSAGNQAPAINGSAPQTAAVGKPYSFQPNATDPNGDPLTFSIDSKPGWATFDQSTGRLYGTPAAADVGTHEEIVVKVTDGKSESALPQFAVTVTSGGSSTTGSATLVWQAPSANTDGSPLENLTGYRIHYGTESGNYSETVSVDTVGLTSYVVENLEPGTYYFTITAVANGVESSFGGEATKTIG